jgi:hypothetical protein
VVDVGYGQDLGDDQRAEGVGYVAVGAGGANTGGVGVVDRLLVLAPPAMNVLANSIPTTSRAPTE